MQVFLQLPGLRCLPDGPCAQQARLLGPSMHIQACIVHTCHGGLNAHLGDLVTDAASCLVAGCVSPNGQPPSQQVLSLEADRDLAGGGVKITLPAARVSWQRDLHNALPDLSLPPGSGTVGTRDGVVSSWGMISIAPVLQDQGQSKSASTPASTVPCWIGCITSRRCLGHLYSIRHSLRQHASD